MVQLNIFVLVLIGLIVNLNCSADIPDMYKLLLSVYYESSCPDSKAFILHQLRPTLQQLHEYVKLEFVPFGKSKSIDYANKGFECHHGPGECLGNMMQDCALDYMRNRTDLERLDYVACEMETEAGTYASLKCVRKANLPKDLVRTCISYEKGIILQLESEFQTELVKPKFVPTVTLNKEFDQQIQDFAMIDLFGTLCSFLTETPPCATHYNNMALRQLFYDTPSSALPFNSVMK